MERNLLHIKKCGKNELDKAEGLSHYLIISLSHYLIISLSHYLIISLSHYRGRFKIVCIVVVKRIILYITNATDGLSHRLQSRRLQNLDIVAANGLSCWFHNAEESFAKDLSWSIFLAARTYSAGRNIVNASNNFKCVLQYS